MINKYFNYTVLTDITIVVVAVAICYCLVNNTLLIIPNDEILLSTSADIANVAFTSAGFVLTFLTLLVSFKISAKPIRKKKKTTLEDAYKKVSLFDLFLNSGLYTETIRHLKIGVKELIITAITGYALKLFLPTIKQEILFYFNVAAIILISLILWRSLLVLSGVLSVQDKKEEESNSSEI